MKVFVDTNVLLDVLQQREPHVQASVLVWKACKDSKIEGVVSALTFANIIYILRKDMTPARVCDILDRLSLIFSFEDFTVQDMKRAAEMEWDDYEDAIQCVQAERICAECIVTRNTQDFAKSETPSEPTPLWWRLAGLLRSRRKSFLRCSRQTRALSSSPLLILPMH